MRIQIINVSDEHVSSELAKRYIEQIALWHYQEWGEIAGKKQIEFQASIEMHIKNKTAEYFVAIDTDSQNQQVVGTISLKERNMEDEYPDAKWGPWLSGLYVHPNYRKFGIAAMLGKKVAENACQKNIEKVYYFTHNFQLAEFYHKLEGECLKPSRDKYYSYHNKSILVYTTKPSMLVQVIDKYLKVKIDGETEFKNPQASPV